MPEKECLICNQKFRPKTPSANLRQCCYDCMPDGVQLHRTDFLNKLREKRGGKCVRCGYDTYLGALEFHHLDPSKKDFTLGNADFRLKEAVEEINKCILICSNCHRELHAGYWEIEDLNLEERDSWYKMILTNIQEQGLKVAIDRYKSGHKYTVISGYA